MKTPVDGNNNKGRRKHSTTRGHSTTSGRKGRWSRVRKRQAQKKKTQEQLLSSAVVVAGSSIPVGACNGGTRCNNKNNKKTKKKSANLSLEDRLLECSKNAQHTGSVWFKEHKSMNEESSDTGGVKKRVVVSTTTGCSLTCLQETAIVHPTTNLTFHVCVQPLLVLDLNGILCHRIRFDERPHVCAASYSRKQPYARYRPSLARIANTPVVPRTDLVSFLSLLDQHFVLAVWTSATRRTAKQLVQVLIPSHMASKLLFVWAQGQCDAQTKIIGDNNKKDTVFVKSLDKVWAAYPIWDESNTLCMDDSPEKCPNVQNTLHPRSIHGLRRECATRAKLMLDQDNQSLQTTFFHQLIRHFQQKPPFNSDDDKTRMFSFLQKHGKGHMGWSGSVAN